MLAQYGVHPPLQLGELGAEGLPVQADPVGRGGTAGRGNVQGVGDGLSQFFESEGEIQVTAEPGPVEALINLRDRPRRAAT